VDTEIRFLDCARLLARRAHDKDSCPRRCADVPDPV
jgi:hypothetical protein